MDTNIQETTTTLGVTQFPLSRVKKIIKEDVDISTISNDATFLIAMTAELFVEWFFTKAYEFAKREKRKTLLYKDLLRAIKEHDSLYFLTDILEETPSNAPAEGSSSSMIKDNALHSDVVSKPELTETTSGMMEETQWTSSLMSSLKKTPDFIESFQVE